MAQANDELTFTAEEIQAEMGDTSSDDAEEAQEDANPDLESDDDVESTWEDDENQQDDDTDAETGKKARKGAPEVRKFKANGKEVDVDMADQPRVDQLITLGLGARAVFTERDSLKKAAAVSAKTISELSKFKTLWGQLEDAKAAGKEALYEKIFGEKFDDVVSARAKAQAEYDAATPEEKRFLDYEKRIKQAEQAQAARDRDAKKAIEAAEAKNREADVREYKSKLSSEFYKFEFSEKVSDPVRAEKLNKTLWRNVIADLKSEFGEADEVPQEAIRRAFKENASVLLGDSKQQAEKQVKKVIDEKKKTAKTQAQAAATRNFNKTDDKALSKITDPKKLWKTMFG